MVDVSDMRPVPDHQEVWADTGADQAVIFEIVEHDPAVPDAEAGRHMFEDAAAGNEAVAAAIQSVAPLGAQDVPGVPEASYRCLVRGRQTVRRGQHGAADTAVMLAVLRLPHVGSDLLITLSTPGTPPQPVGDAAVAVAALGEGKQQEVMAGVLRSLRVQSWELFG